MSIDLNCDMGESFGPYTLGLDEHAIRYITSANVACGWHAGDPMVMDRTVRLAKEHGVSVGAHPSYPDRFGFGRRDMDCSPDEIRNYVTYQVGALGAFCAANGVRLTHVKPHGSLYLTAVEREDVARAVAEAVVRVDPELVYVALAGAKGDLMSRVGREVGLRVAFEAFPDRAYSPEGTLLSRRREGAVIEDPERVSERALMIARDKRVIAIDGSGIDLEAQTLCVHGDTPGAVELVRGIRRALEAEGLSIEPMAARN